MVVRIDNKDVIIDFDEDLSKKSLDTYTESIKTALQQGCDKLMLNFDRVENFDNKFLDFVLSAKEVISSVNFYNVDISLLPAFYLMKIDQIASFYTSKHDALVEQKPIIKRRLGLIHQKALLFLSTILVLKDIT